MASRGCLDLNDCGTVANKPAVGPVALSASLNQNYYRCNVQPILAKTCAMVGCHGVRDPIASGRRFQVFARARERNDETVTNAVNPCPPFTAVSVYLPDVSGTASCLAAEKLSNTEWQVNFDSARLFMVGDAGISNVPVALNELLAQPGRGTSYPHAGIKPWKTTDADYQVISNWLNGMTLATCNTGKN